MNFNHTRNAKQSHEATRRHEYNSDSIRGMHQTELTRKSKSLETREEKSFSVRHRHRMKKLFDNVYFESCTATEGERETERESITAVAISFNERMARWEPGNRDRKIATRGEGKWGGREGGLKTKQRRGWRKRERERELRRRSLFFWSVNSLPLPVSVSVCFFFPSSVLCNVRYRVKATLSTR